jgi:hypothetical protein
MKTTWMLAAAGALMSTAALAQSTPSTTANPPPQTKSDSTHVSSASLQQEVKTNLQQAGFSNVTVVPDSFLVEAKDKAGNPVTMMINPNSVTEVVDDSSTAPGQAGATAGATGSMFTTVSPNADLSSKVVGIDVHNSANQDIGTIKDLAYSGHTLRAYILSVGGFLGVGDHEVAVTPSALHVTFDGNSKTWHAMIDATQAQLKAAPQFKYPSQS